MIWEDIEATVVESDGLHLSAPEGERKRLILLHKIVLANTKARIGNVSESHQWLTAEIR